MHLSTVYMRRILLEVCFDVEPQPEYAIFGCTQYLLRVTGLMLQYW